MSEIARNFRRGIRRSAPVAMGLSNRPCHREFHTTMPWGVARKLPCHGPLHHALAMGCLTMRHVARSVPSGMTSCHAAPVPYGSRAMAGLPYCHSVRCPILRRPMMGRSQIGFLESGLYQKCIGGGCPLRAFERKRLRLPVKGPRPVGGHLRTLRGCSEGPVTRGFRPSFYRV